MNGRFKVLKILFILFLLNRKLVKCEINPSVSIELLNSGFHRDLQYTVHFHFLEDFNCKFLLQQNFPAGVYINVDQIDDLVRLKKLNAIYPPHIDVELPTELSHPFTILLGLSPEFKQKLKVPIHFRYHLPGNKTFVKVELDEPLMYTKCDNQNSNAPVKSQEYCLNGLQFIPTEDNFDGNCNWIQVDYNSYIKTPLKVNIAIGDERLQEPVTYITLLIGWIGCACILFTANNKMKILDKKLK